MEQHPDQGGDLQSTPEPDRPQSDIDRVEQEDSPRLRPHIYAASTHDFNFGIQHGVWLDADQPPEQLLAGIEAMLRTSPIAREFGLLTEEWAVHDTRDFAGLEISQDETLTAISKLARKLVAHGPAYAHWAEHVGVHDAEQLDAFDQVYVGRWETVHAFVDHVLDDLGAPTYVANAPETYRKYLVLDRNALAHELQNQLVIIHGSDGVHVFDPHEHE